MSRGQGLEGLSHRLGRRAFLRTALVGAGGALLGACQAPAPAAAPGSAGAPAGRAAATPAGAPGWQQQWDALVAAAKQEGRLILHGPPRMETRQAVTTAFQQRFGIPVEYISLRTSELAPKMVAEKQAGVVSVDAMISGIGSFADVLYPAGLLADQRSHLILPEVTDPSYWLPEPSLFIDPEQNRLLRLINSVTPILAINRDYVDPAMLRTAQDLLRPEFRGRIVSDDPLVAGSGALAPAYFLDLFGEEFVRKLYAEQVVADRDPRQRSDGLARGRYPLGLGPGTADVQALIEDGFPIEVVTLADAPGYTSGAFGVSALVEGSPRPNAARLFAN